MEKNIDLHIHSNYSDGEFSLEDLINDIRERGVGTFSITDHDNIESCNQIKKMALGELNYIKGVEISSVIGNYNIHVLGYDFNETISDMNSLLKIIRQKRVDRVLDMLAFLKDTYGIVFKEEDIMGVLSTKAAIGKPHVINLLYMYGYGTSNRGLYEKYVKDHDFISNYRVPSMDSIAAIKSCNGLAILAHPKEVEDEYHIDINDIIGNLIEQGIDGIEVYNSLHNLKDIRKYLEIAKQYNLLISGGSDYHGVFIKPTVNIGNVSQENIQIKRLTLVDKIYQRSL